jgi:hypothetical protein
MVAAATIGSSVIGAVGSAVAGNSAASAQEAAANSANATQLQMFNKAQENLAPYVKLGTDTMQPYQSALSRLAGIDPFSQNFSFNGNDLSSNPGFQFASTQGLKSVQNQMAQRGLGYSGAQIKGAENFETGLANQYYNDYFNQALNTYNTALNKYQTNYNVASGQASALSGAVQLGQNAAAGVGTAAVNTGNSIAQNTIGAGNAAAAGRIATGNAISGAASSVGSGALLNQILGGGGGGMPGGGSGGMYGGFSIGNASPLASPGTYDYYSAGGFGGGLMGY